MPKPLMPTTGKIYFTGKREKMLSILFFSELRNSSTLGTPGVHLHVFNGTYRPRERKGVVKILLTHIRKWLQSHE